MTLRHRTTVRTVAAGSALGLTATAAAVLGTAVPASAAATLNLDCTVPIVGAKTFSVQMDTNAPARLTTGSATRPKLTTVMTVPTDLADLMRGVLSTDTISGTITSHMTVNGVETPVTVTIPATAVPESGAIPLQGTGTFSAITAGKPGKAITLGAGDQDVMMTLVDSDGDPAGSPFEIPCTPTDGQDLTVDTVNVVKAGSTTRVGATYQARKDTAVGRATVKTSNRIAATGKVKFILKRGAHKVGAATRTLHGGKAAATFKKIHKHGTYKLTVQYLGSTRVNRSTGSDTFRVR